MNIELHIEELVLQGFSHSHRGAIGRAIETELSRLLTDRGLPASLSGGRDVRSLDAGSFVVEHGARPSAIGAHVGQLLYEGMTR
ncbi:MAG TPA: hypothetical protein VIR57_14950 [Chloroflexota bacterium]|jgi:hypothetical protein